MSANAGRLDPPQLVGGQQQHEQGDRETDAKRERFDGAIASAFVAHQENQRGAEAGQYQDEGGGDNDFHVGDSSAIMRLAWRRLRRVGH